MSETAIRGVTRGDSFQIIRTVDNIPEGESVTKAWLTIKLNPGRTDSEAALQKAITIVDVPGTGLITNGSPVGSVDLRFDISGTDWDRIVAGQLYRHDIKILTDGGGIYTCERGTFVADSEITQARS